MKEQPYRAFFAPYLQTAEQTLAVVAYLKHNPDASCAQKYFSALLNYNVACFHYQMKNNTFTRGTLKYQSEQLLLAITAIKNNYSLAWDPMLEHEKTIQIFDQANRAFCTHISFFKKIYLKGLLALI